MATPELTEAQKSAWDIANKIQKVRGAGAPGTVIAPAGDVPSHSPVSSVLDAVMNFGTRDNSNSRGSLENASDTYSNWGRADTPLPATLKTGGVAPAAKKYDVPDIAQNSPSGAAAPADTTPKYEKGSLQEKYKGDVYAAVKDLNDKQFKQFVDKHQDTLPGIGYVGDNDISFDKNGKAKGKFFRSVENPADKPAQEESMTLLQGQNVANLLTALGHYQTGVGNKQYANAIAQQNADTKKSTLENKGNEDVDKIISLYGKTTGATGEPTINPELAYFKMGINKTPLPSSLNEKDRKAHETAIEQATAPFFTEVKKLETKYKRPATPAEIRSLASTYQKMRFGLQQ